MPFRRKKQSLSEAHDEARLMDAERESKNLSERAENAVRFLEDRRRRNHWQESIQQIIQGAR